MAGFTVSVDRADGERREVRAGCCRAFGCYYRVGTGVAAWPVASLALWGSLGRPLDIVLRMPLHLTLFGELRNPTSHAVWGITKPCISCCVENPQFLVGGDHRFGQCRHTINHIVSATFGWITSPHPIICIFLELKSNCQEEGVFDSTDGPCKILQSRWRYSALFWIAGKYYSIRWNLAIPLQILRNTKGETYSRALNDSGGRYHHLAIQFERYERLAASDGDGAVARAERSQRHLFEERQCKHNECRAHWVNNIRGRWLQTYKKLKSRLCAFSSSLELGAMKNLYKKCYKEKVIEAVEYNTVDLPDPQDVDRLDSILDAFVGHETRDRRSRCSNISACLNGGIPDSSSGKLIHYERVCGQCGDVHDCHKLSLGTFPPPFVLVIGRAGWRDQRPLDPPI